MTAPALIGRYEVIRELGRGAMGTVFLARDTALGRLVAMKTFRASPGVADPEDSGVLRRRTLREAQQAGALSHPNVITIYDVVEGHDADTFHIVMEYVDGESLDDRMREGGPMKLAEVASIVGQIAAALDHLHSRGIVHRDVKPGNVLVADDGRIKITDFGLARSEDPAATLDTQIYGTPYYMSPEQIQGHPPDARSDVFALGVVVYEMLTGSRPFPGATVAEVAHRIVYGEPDEPAVDGQPLPLAVRGTILRALDKDPAARFASAGELADVLRQLADGSLDLERTPTTALPRRSWLGAPLPRRSSPRPMARVAAVVAIVALLLFAGGVVYTRWFKSPPLDPTDGELQARQIGYVKLVSEGKRLLDEGDPQGASLLFATAEQLAVDPAAARAMREEAQRRVEEEGAHSQVLDAKQALARGRYDQVVATARKMLETRAGREQAAGVLAEVETALAEGRRAPAPAPRPAVEPPSAPSEPARNPVAEAPAPAAPAIDFAVLHVDLDTSAPEGDLTLWVDGRQMARQHFAFFVREGWFRKKPMPGSWSTDLKLDPGRHHVKVLVSRQGEPGQASELDAVVEAGDLHTLAIALPAKGGPIVALR